MHRRWRDAETKDDTIGGMFPAASSEEGRAVNRLVIRAPNWLGDAVMALPAMGGAARGVSRGAYRRRRDSVGRAALRRRDQRPAGQRDRRLPMRASRGRGADAPAGSTRSCSCRTRSGRRGRRRRAAIPERWGYAAGFAAWLLTRAVSRPRGRVHQSTYYLDLVDGAGRSADGDPWPRVGVRPATLARADALLGGARRRRRTPAASGSRPARRTATRSAGRRAWSPRRSSALSRESRAPVRPGRRRRRPRRRA